MKNHKDKKKGKGNLSSTHSAASDGKVISDPRYSKAHTDPRFREAPKRETKVAIDSRFNRMFTHKSFLPSSAPVDKRGKPKKNPTSQLGSLRHYYKIDEKVEQSSDEEEEKEELVKANRVKPESENGAKSEESSRYESSAESEETSESESALDTDTDIDTDEGADEEVYEEEAFGVQEDIAEIDKETHRLAVVNMDWRYVKAVDLYVLFNSFVPPNGLIKSVAVYPTDFGLQRMKEEEVHGPVGLFDDEKEKSDEDSDNDDIYNEKLRAYEKSRMRYYFALVECDSSATADYIYEQCNGLEFKQSSNALDLRFIPDNMEFKSPPQDVATEVPANYEGKDFYSRALQHSKVNLSWEEDEPLRAKTLNRKLTDAQLAQFELKEFLASDESESNDSKDNNETDDQLDKRARKQAKYRDLLLQSGVDSDGGDEHYNAQDMEVTFNTGLEDLSKHIMEKKDKKSETVWDAYLKKRREKKKARKNKTKYSSDDDDSDDTDQEATEEADDFFIEEPAVKKRKKAQNKVDEEHKPQEMNGLDKVSKEELELLLADDKGTDTSLKGYNLKLKKGKGKRRENAIDEEKIPNSSYDDPRFAALFSPDYAIDPTDPQFKRSAVYARQLAKKQQKDNADSSAEREHTKLKGKQLSSDDSGMMKMGEEEGSDALKSKKDAYELSSLVKSIKMKSKQIQLPSDVMTRKDGKSQIKGMKKKRH